VTDPHAKLTTDPPRPPGTPDVDELVGDPIPAAPHGRRSEPDDEDIVSQTVAAEPPD